MVSKVSTFLVLALFSGIVKASEHCDSLKVVSAHDWYPIAFTAKDPHDKSHGIAIELVETIAKEHNVAIEILGSLPWKRATMWMDKGKVDVLTGHYLSSQRLNNWQVSSAWFYDDIRVFTRKELASKLTHENITHYRGAYPAGASYGDEVDNKIKNKLDAVPFRDNTLLFSALIKDRVDYIITAKQDGLAHLTKLKLENDIAMSPISLAERSIHLSFSKKSPCLYLFDKFNASIDKHVANGDPQAWLAKSNIYFVIKP